MESNLDRGVADEKLYWYHWDSDKVRAQLSNDDFEAFINIIRADRDRCIQTMKCAQAVKTTFDDYMVLFGGDREAARVQLKRKFSIEEIKQAIAWGGYKWSEMEGITHGKV